MKKWLCRDFCNSNEVILVEYELDWNKSINKWEFPDKSFVKFGDYEVFERPIEAICYRFNCIDESIDYYTAAIEDSSSPEDDELEFWKGQVEHYKLVRENVLKLYEEYNNV